MDNKGAIPTPASPVEGPSNTMRIETPEKGSPLTAPNEAPQNPAQRLMQDKVISQGERSHATGDPRPKEVLGDLASMDPDARPVGSTKSEFTGPQDEGERIALGMKPLDTVAKPDFGQQVIDARNRANAVDAVTREHIHDDTYGSEEYIPNELRTAQESETGEVNEANDDEARALDSVIDNDPAASKDPKIRDALKAALRRKLQRVKRVLAPPSPQINLDLRSTARQNYLDGKQKGGVPEGASTEPTDEGVSGQTAEGDQASQSDEAVQQNLRAEGNTTTDGSADQPSGQNGEQGANTQRYAPESTASQIAKSTTGETSDVTTSADTANSTQATTEGGATTGAAEQPGVTEQETSEYPSDARFHEIVGEMTIKKLQKGETIDAATMNQALEQYKQEKAKKSTETTANTTSTTETTSDKTGSTSPAAETGAGTTETQKSPEEMTKEELLEENKKLRQENQELKGQVEALTRQVEKLTQQVEKLTKALTQALEELKKREPKPEESVWAQILAALLAGAGEAVKADLQADVQAVTGGIGAKQ